MIHYSLIIPWIMLHALLDTHLVAIAAANQTSDSPKTRFRAHCTIEVIPLMLHFVLIIKLPSFPLAMIVCCVAWLLICAQPLLNVLIGEQLNRVYVLGLPEPH